MLVLTVVLQLASPSSISVQSCIERTSYYCKTPEGFETWAFLIITAPVINSQRISVQEVQIHGTLFPPAEEDMHWAWREPGDSAGEAMWESFELLPMIPITADEVRGLGKDPETVARFDDELFGHGDDAYIASLDIQHKLHCLNELRKMAFEDYGDDNAEKKAHGQVSWIHLRHCTAMLAQDLLCHADADLFTYNWVDSQRFPFPDFAINRKCRNIDDVFAYSNERQLDPDKWSLMRKPDGVHQVPNEPGYYAKVSKPEVFHCVLRLIRLVLSKEQFGFSHSDLYPNGTGGPPLPEPTWFGEKGNWHWQDED